jgi:PAT family beta-lactamase induction signal transducer AmpG
VKVAKRLWTLLGADHLPSSSRRKLGIVAFLYFLEGAPPAILWEVLPVYFRVSGASLAAIGGLRLLELPYSLKVFWSPLVHRYGDRRAWMCGCLLVAGTAIALMPFLEVAHPGWVVFGLVLLLAAASATQDVAIDSYTVGLVDPAEQGAANGVRASAYRVALVLVGGVLLMSTPLMGWAGLFLTATVLLGGLALASPRLPRLDLPAEARRAWKAGFLEWVRTWRAVPLVLFVLCYKLGEFAIGPMIKPFWVDQGRSLFEIGLVPTSIGIGLSVAGALTGGGFIARFGVFHGVWALGLLQAASNLGYAVVAWGNLGRLGLYGASVFESFTGGLGTAAFLAFLMNVCDKEHATVQYAFLSSLFALTGRLAGAVSGLGAERLGYGDYFASTFFLSLPALALLPWVKPWIRETPATK